MIYVDRNRIAVPEVFSSKELEIAGKRLEEFYNKPIDSRRQQRYSRPFEPELRIPINRALHDLFRGKCAYCETAVPKGGKSEYDHFRPKSGTRGIDNEFAEEHYWWLTYEWQNFYLSCHMCNRYKSSWFPVKGRRAKLKTPYKLIIQKEKSLLIDPCIDNPDEHLKFDTNGEIHGKTEKGKITVDILKLNRSELIDGRIEAVKDEFGEWERILKYWNRERTQLITVFDDWQRIMDGSSEKPFLAVRQNLIKDRLATQPEIEEYFNLGKYLDLLEEEGDEKGGGSIEIEETTILSFDEYIKTIGEEKEEELQDSEIEHQSIKGHVYIESIELRNFKCFDHLSINFNEDSPIYLDSGEDETKTKREPWKVFLGENGVGKSSVLQAIALCLMGENYRNKLEGITPDSVLKNGTTDGFIKLRLVGEKRVLVLRFHEGQKQFNASVKSPLTLMSGYGSVRVMPKGYIVSERQSNSVTRVKNLFDYSVALTDSKKWLLRKDWNPKQFGEIALALKDLLNLENEDRIIRSKNELFIERNGKKEQLEQQSDGYKTVIALAVDIMAFFMKEGVSFKVAEGIVLIDELGSHLHPRWKMLIVDRLRKTFPRMQFIVTTHEPLCLRGVKNGEVTVMIKNIQQEIITITELPDPSVLRVDQLLTSPFFGLSSAIDPDMEGIFNEYYNLLAKKDEDRTGEEQEKFHILQEKLPQIEYLGDTLREELALYIIDELIAQVRSGEIKEQKIEKLKPEVKKRVEDIWEKLDNENLKIQ